MQNACSVKNPSAEWVLRRVRQRLRLVVIQILNRNSDVLKYLEQCLSEMSESNCAVVREVLLDQYMTVEASHLRNSEHTDASEGLCRYRKNLALCDVSAELAVSSGLQTVEGDIAGHDVSLERSVCTSTGRLLAMIFWFLISQKASFLEQVFPQWKPMKVSLCV